MVSEEELRREAVRRRIAGESPLAIAEALGRSSRWVRKWVARHGEGGHDDGWAQGRASEAAAVDPLRATHPAPGPGRIEVVRYIRSSRRIDLFGRRITVAEDQTHQYVTAIIKVRAKSVIVVTMDGEIIHSGDYPIARSLR